VSFGASLLDQNTGSVSSASPYTTGTLTSAGAQVVLVFVAFDALNTQTVSGTGVFGVTWTQVTALDSGSATVKDMRVFRGVPTGAGTGDLTIATNAGILKGMSYQVVQYDGVDQATAQGVVQSSTTFDNTAQTSKAASLSAFGKADNATVYWAFMRANTTFTPPSGYTGNTQASANGTLGVEVKPSQDTAPTGTFGAADELNVGALELKTITIIDTAITPAAGALALTGTTSIVAAGSLAVPATGVLDLTGAAPSTLIDALATPSAGALALAGAAPSRVRSSVFMPAAGALALTTSAPLRSDSGTPTLTPNAGALTLTGTAPLIPSPVLLTPSAGTLTLAGVAPTGFASGAPQPTPQKRWAPRWLVELDMPT